MARGLRQVLGNALLSLVVELSHHELAARIASAYLDKGGTEKIGVTAAATTHVGNRGGLTSLSLSLASPWNGPASVVHVILDNIRGGCARRFYRRGEPLPLHKLPACPRDMRLDWREGGGDGKKKRKRLK
jgi:hypothetical protein